MIQNPDICRHRPPSRQPAFYAMALKWIQTKANIWHLELVQI